MKGMLLLLFSQRIGKKDIRTVIQKESMDSILRTKLWNCFTKNYKNTRNVVNSYGNTLDGSMKHLAYELWDNFFYNPIDSIPIYWSTFYKQIKIAFFNFNWYEVYDFIEFIPNTYNSLYENSQFMKECNIIFEKELSAYRFVNGKITEITSEIEIDSIESAIKSTNIFSNINVHLDTALSMIADRDNPDYRNSIKESISAVEGLCSIVCEDSKASLGKALKQIEKNNILQIHPTLKSAFEKLYGYTSDAEGIRHALLDECTLNFEDAKFMLVSCSAFINYLIEKWQKQNTIKRTVD